MVSRGQIFKNFKNSNGEVMKISKMMKNFEVEEVGAEEVGFQRKYSGRVVQIVYKIYNFKIFKIAK